MMEKAKSRRCLKRERQRRNRKLRALYAADCQVTRKVLELLLKDKQSPPLDKKEFWNKCNEIKMPVSYVFPDGSSCMSWDEDGQMCRTWSEAWRSVMGDKPTGSITLVNPKHKAKL